jgi:hypothetical protein
MPEYPKWKIAAGFLVACVLGFLVWLIINKVPKVVLPSKKQLSLSDLRAMQIQYTPEMMAADKAKGSLRDSKQFRQFIAASILTKLYDEMSAKTGVAVLALPFLGGNSINGFFTPGTKLTPGLSQGGPKGPEVPLGTLIPGLMDTEASAKSMHANVYGAMKAPSLKMSEYFKNLNKKIFENPVAPRLKNIVVGPLDAQLTQSRILDFEPTFRELLFNVLSDDKHEVMVPFYTALDAQALAGKVDAFTGEALLKTLEEAKVFSKLIPAVMKSVCTEAGGVLGENNGSLFCSYNEAQCNSHYKWPLSPEDPHLYSVYDKQGGRCNASIPIARVISEKFGFQYDPSAGAPIITEPACLALGGTYTTGASPECNVNYEKLAWN